MENLEPAARVEHLDAPHDPFADRPHHAEDIGDDEASERIHEFLRGYEDGDLLGGWVIFHEWIDADGSHAVGWNISPDLDWARVLGIIAVGQMKAQREFLNAPDED